MKLGAIASETSRFRYAAKPPNLSIEEYTSIQWYPIQMHNLSVIHLSEAEEVHTGTSTCTAVQHFGPQLRTMHPIYCHAAHEWDASSRILKSAVETSQFQSTFSILSDTPRRYASVVRLNSRYTMELHDWKFSREPPFPSTSTSLSALRDSHGYATLENGHWGAVDRSAAKGGRSSA